MELEMDKHVTFSGKNTPKQQQQFIKSRSKSRQNCRQKYTPTYNQVFLTGSAYQKTENGGGESGLRVKFNYLSLIL